MEGKPDLMTLKEKVGHRTTNQSQFLYQLYAILEDGECADIISWSSNGQNVVIKDQVRMSELVLPKYFNGSKYASFLRQLNYYGFKKASTVALDKIYFHTFFKKGGYELLTLIKRSVHKKSSMSEVSKTESPIQLKNGDSGEKLRDPEKEALILKLKTAEALIGELRRENYRLVLLINEQIRNQQSVNFKKEPHEQSFYPNFQPTEENRYFSDAPKMQNYQRSIGNQFKSSDSEPFEYPQTKKLCCCNRDHRLRYPPRLVPRSALQSNSNMSEMIPFSEGSLFNPSSSYSQCLDQENCFNQTFKSDF